MSPRSDPPNALFGLIEDKLGNPPTAQIARTLGISRALYGMWRVGKFSLSVWQLLELHDLFDLDWDEILIAIRKQYPPEVIAEIKARYITPESKKVKKVKNKGKKV
jgi:hypothetical protein